MGAPRNPHPHSPAFFSVRQPPLPVLLCANPFPPHTSPLRARVLRTAALEPLAGVPLPSSLILSDGMSVTFPAYLAIFLGTLIPVAFLIILYIQAEARKAGEKSVRDD